MRSDSRGGCENRLSVIVKNKLFCSFVACFIYIVRVESKIIVRSIDVSKLCLLFVRLSRSVHYLAFCSSCARAFFEVCSLSCALKCAQPLSLALHRSSPESSIETHLSERYKLNWKAKERKFSLYVRFKG
jgi:hypothetical protein